MSDSLRTQRKTDLNSHHHPRPLRRQHILPVRARPEQIPTIVALAPHLRGTRRRGGFEYGLDTLLAGLNATNSDTALAR